MSIPFAIVIAWHNKTQATLFGDAWNVNLNNLPDWLVMQQDKNKEGCAVTKNKGIAVARELDPEVIVVLDDDCYPCLPYRHWRDTAFGVTETASLENFAEAHRQALEPQEVELFEAVTDPPSRGTPYFNRTVKMPVAASMGFWTENPDWDAVRQLTCDDPLRFPPVKYHRQTMFWRFFPLSGMNLAWNDKAWCDLVKFHEGAERFDDIWLGFKWQARAYRAGHCFNLNGPMVRHVRQSNVWNNLKVEAQNLEKNETIWKESIVWDSLI